MYKRQVYALSYASPSIYTFNIDSTAGALTQVGNPTAVTIGYGGGNSSAYVTNIFALDVNSKFLFVDKTYQDSYGGTSSIDTFKIDAVTGIPSYGSTTAVVSYPGGSSGFALDPTGSYLYLTHRGMSKIYVLSIDPLTGTTAVIQTVTNPLGYSEKWSRKFEQHDKWKLRA